MVREYGLQNNVQLIDKYLDFDELVSYLARDRHLSHAVSEPGADRQRHARLCGRLRQGDRLDAVPLRAGTACAPSRLLVRVPRRQLDRANSSTLLLDDPSLRRATERRAYRFGRQMTWPHVAAGVRTRSSASSVRADRLEAGVLCLSRARPTLPPLDHLVALTDDVGVIQHAVENVPEPRDRLLHRRCLARVHGRARARAPCARAIERSAAPRVRSISSFLHDAQLDDGRFHNFMSYDRRWLDEVGTHDSCGRAIWALGYGVRYAPRDAWRRVCGQMLDRALARSRLAGVHPRAQAYAATRSRARGRRAKPTPGYAIGVAQARGAIDRRRYEATATADWHWFENAMTYDNARLPEAMLRAGPALADRRYVAIGLRTLDLLRERDG